jgi:hypothetical protein
MMAVVHKFAVVLTIVIALHGAANTSSSDEEDRHYAQEFPADFEEMVSDKIYWIDSSIKKIAQTNPH